MAVRTGFGPGPDPGSQADQPTRNTHRDPLAAISANRSASCRVEAG